MNLFGSVALFLLVCTAGAWAYGNYFTENSNYDTKGQIALAAMLLSGGLLILWLLGGLVFLIFR